MVIDVFESLLGSTIPAGPTAALDFAGILASASPALMLAIFIIAMLKRWLILPRELDTQLTERDKRVEELTRERDEYKVMAFRALNIGERVVTVTEERNLR